MQTVAVELEQKFEEYVSKAEAGEEVFFVRDGIPVARIVPISASSSEATRLEALERLKQTMEKGFDLGGLRINRDELYDRV